MKAKIILGLLVFVVIVVLVVVGIKMTGRPKLQLPEGGTFDDYATQLAWARYVNTKYQIVFPYPRSWSMNTRTSIFENGDLITVEFIGPTQTEQTEFFDGARLVVMIPQATAMDLAAWIDSQYQALPGENPPQVTDVQLNGRNFKKVYTCGLGCFSYYYTIIDGQVYGVMVSAAGPQQTELEATLEQMLRKLKLGS